VHGCSRMVVTGQVRTVKRKDYDEELDGEVQRKRVA